MQQHKPYRYLLGIVATMAFIVSCSKTPRGILSEKQMQSVLTDMQIAEAMIGLDPTAYQDSGYKEGLYESVFRKHKINQAKYDSSLVWYGKNLDIYIKMVDRAKTDLDSRIKALGNVQAAAAPTTRQDSVDIWPRRPYLQFMPEAPFNGVTFDIKPDRNYSSGSIFVLGMKVWGLTDNMPHYPEIRMAADQGDTTVIINSTITHDGYHEAILRTVATKQVRRVYGYIRMDYGEANYFRIYADSVNLMRYNYRSDFSTELSDTTAVATPAPEDVSLEVTE